LPPLDVLVSFGAVGDDHDAGRAVWALAIEDLSAGRIISQQAEMAARQQAAIANLGLRALTEPELPRLLNRLCSVARQLLEVDRVAYWEFWQEALPVARLAAGDGWERDVVGKLEVSLDMDTPLARVLTSRRPMVIRDDGRQAAAWHLEGGRPIHASLVTPVTDDSRVTGALCILHGANRGYTEDDVNFVTALSTVIASAEARRRYERELIARTEALSRAEDDVRTERAERLIELGAVAGAVAHQVNNAVNSIQMNADLALLLLERAAEDATVRESLERIRADCGRCAAVVREVLALARSEAPAPAESLPLAACLDEAVGILRRGAGPAPELRRHRSIGMATVFGRRLELGLAFANLARTRGEAGASWVQVTAAAREDRLRVEMVDNGPPPEHAGLPGLFDNLVPGRVATGGLGLGLAHRIISDHSGNIAADAPESGGFRFIIELPATATAA
jgi:signal transduction histidine kinase